MATYNKEELKALEALDKALAAVQALGGWSHAQEDAMEAAVGSVKTFVVNRVIDRTNTEQYPAVLPAVETSEDEPFSVESGDQGSATDKSG